VDNEKRRIPKDPAPSTNTPTASTHHGNRTAIGDSNADRDVRRGRFTRAYYRSPRYDDCMCHEPCRCSFHANPSSKRVDAFLEAAEWLEGHGLAPAALLPECRQLWQRGGSDRQLADDTVRRWSA